MPKKRRKYQIGIQEAVYKAIEYNKRKDHPYISKKDIIIYLKQKGISLSNPNAQVGQAIRQLQKKTKFQAPSTEGLSPIGVEFLTKSFERLEPSFVYFTKRSASVYKGGIPFQVEAGSRFKAGSTF